MVKVPLFRCDGSGRYDHLRLYAGRNPTAELRTITQQEMGSQDVVKKTRTPYLDGYKDTVITRLPEGFFSYSLVVKPINNFIY